MIGKNSKNIIITFLIVGIIIAVCAFCNILSDNGDNASTSQAYKGSVSEISMVFTDPNGQKPVRNVQIALIRGHDNANEKSLYQLITGEERQKPVQDMQIERIRGRDNPDGKSLYWAITGEDGCARLKVPFGEYTVQWQAEGYYGGCQNITAEGEAISLQRNIFPYAENISAYILLEWEGEEDLDLCVYDEHSERCIGSVSDVEDMDSRLYEDNNGEKGYELVYLKSGTTKNYIIYVKDSDRITENRDSSMGQSRATVSIYTRDGLLYQKTAEGGTDALWKCSLLREGEVTEQDEYIHDRTDYAWAERDKHNPLSWVKESDVKVKEVYYYAGGGIDKIYRVEYDNKGNDIAWLDYDADGQMRDGWRQEGAYDEQGNWLAYSWQFYEDGRRTARMDYQYDEHGEITRRLFYNLGLLITSHRWENSYDTKGNKISCYEYDDLQNQYVPSELYKWEYDEAGNKTAEWHEEEGLPKYGYTSERNEAGNLIWDCEYWYEKGKLDSREESEYDGEGNAIKRSWYIGHNGREELRSREESEYDGEGNKIKKTWYIGHNGREELEHWEEYEYDARGNRTASYTYSSSGILNKIIEEEYDENDRITFCFIHDYDSEWMERTEHTYDAEGREISLITRRDNDCDGIYERRTEWFYFYNEGGSLEGHYDYEDEILTEGYRHEYDYMGNETASYSYIDGSWKREYLHEYRYKYDTTAGILVTDFYEDDILQTRTITIYR